MAVGGVAGRNTGKGTGGNGAAWNIAGGTGGNGAGDVHHGTAGNGAGRAGRHGVAADGAGRASRHSAGVHGAGAAVPHGPRHRAARGSRFAGRHPGIAPSRARRALDVLVSAAGLAVVGIPLLLLMLAVRLETPGPALFRQVRLGQGGRPFTLYKLRSMHVDASGSDLTAVGDPRVTRLGALLRATSLDELPQLWNVLRGQMTLVGPRPETPRLAAAYPPHCRWIFLHRPGLTGPAQVRMRDADVLGGADTADTPAYLSRIVPARAAIEARFLATPTLRSTLLVLWDTVRHLSGRPVPQR